MPRFARSYCGRVHRRIGALANARPSSKRSAIHDLKSGGGARGVEQNGAGANAQPTGGPTATREGRGRVALSPPSRSRVRQTLPVRSPLADSGRVPKVAGRFASTTARPIAKFDRRHSASQLCKHGDMATLRRLILCATTSSPINLESLAAVAKSLKYTLQKPPAPKVSGKERCRPCLKSCAMLGRAA